MKHSWTPSWASWRTSRSLRIWSKNLSTCRRPTRTILSWTRGSHLNSRNWVNWSRSRWLWLMRCANKRPRSWALMWIYVSRVHTHTCLRRTRSTLMRRSERRPINGTRPSRWRRGSWRSQWTTFRRRLRSTPTSRRSTRRSSRRSSPRSWSSCRATTQPWSRPRNSFLR